MGKKDGEFSEEDKIKCLLWCNRHCCLCGKACGTNIEIAHIIQKGKEGSTSNIDNAIPLCFDCHSEIGKYNAEHPKGNKYRPKELKARREQIYEEYTRHLVPPINYTITQEQFNNPKRTLPNIGFNIHHLGDALPVKALVNIAIFLDGKYIGKPEAGLYAGEHLWNLNPRFAIFGHFYAPKVVVNGTGKLEVKVEITVIDQYEREHRLLPIGYVYIREDNSWYLEPCPP
ncbi:MAG: HNH endonuclease [Deltaproteobacteria bacterium]|nr:HNH endonuclease [Deltaproteobacteria bacterium]